LAIHPEGCCLHNQQKVRQLKYDVLIPLGYLPPCQLVIPVIRQVLQAMAYVRVPVRI